MSWDDARKDEKRRAAERGNRRWREEFVSNMTRRLSNNTDALAILHGINVETLRNEVADAIPKQRLKAEDLHLDAEISSQPLGLTADSSLSADEKPLMTDMSSMAVRRVSHSVLSEVRLGQRRNVLNKVYRRILTAPTAINPAPNTSKVGGIGTGDDGTSVRERSCP